MSTSLTPPQVLCTAKAIYSFYSEDSSELNFNKEDLIEVFTKLKTGWWNGWCNGRRGWFPSNYVEILSEGEYLAPPMTDDIVLNQKFNRDSFEPVLQQDSDTEIADLDNKHKDSDIDQSNSSSNGAQTPKELMKNWVQRKNPQGRPYYCNLLTQETTWDYEEIDKDTGLLKKSNSTVEDDDNPSIEDDNEQYENEIEFPDEITWNKLSIDIALSIQQLIITSQNTSNYDELLLKTSAVVKAIRLMLYASHSIEKNSELLQNPIFRELRKMVISSLSKLLLSTRMTYEAPNQFNVAKIVTQKIQREAKELLVAARNFVSTYTQHNIPLHRIHPEFLDIAMTDSYINTTTESIDSSTSSSLNEDPSVPSKSKFFLNQDLISNLQAHTNQIFNLIKELSSVAASQPNDDSDSLLTLYKTLSMQTTQFFGILDDINFENAQVENRVDFNTYLSSRQSLYEAVGLLFSVIQLSTDINLGLDTAGLDKALSGVRLSLEEIERSVTLMVNERKRNMSISNDDYITMSPTSTYHEMRFSFLNEDDSTTSSVIHRNRSFSHESTITDDNNSRKSSLYMFPTSSSRRTVRAVHIKDIEFGNDNTIKGGTIAALVERLTAHDTLDTAFIATFLLTYRSFCTTEDFVNLLEDRYNILPPEILTPEQLEVWTETKQKLIRLRVFNVLKNWLENYYIEEDAYLLAQIEHFTKTTIIDVSSLAANQLLRIIKKRVDSQGEMKRIVPNPISGPDPIYPKNLSNITLLETDPLEMARQLSIMDFKLYSRIRPIECLGKAWSKEDLNGVVATNIKQSIQYCNHLTTFVTDSILRPNDIKKRAAVIKYWVQVAENCKNMNNFNTCMAVLSSFDNSSIGRLKKTWSTVNGKTSQTLAEIRKLMGANRNFQEYRDLIHSINPPCIPFLGIYLQDLTFIEDGNPDFLRGSNNLINFGKRQKTAQVILELKQFQPFAYNFYIIDEIQTFIQSQLKINYDVEKMYNRSLKLEPKTPDATTVAMSNILSNIV